MIKSQVIEGQKLTELKNKVIGKGECHFGVLGAENSGFTLNDKLLQRHMLAIGSIGSGKTNLMSLMIHELRKHANEDDVFIFFDAKGDYYKDFYHEGDYVISNQSDLFKGNTNWNMYEEILLTPPHKREEFIRELATAFFKEDIEHSSSPIFAIGARDLFAGIIQAQVKNIEKGAEMMDHEKFIQFLRTATDAKIRNLLLDHKELKWIRDYIPKGNPQMAKSFLVHLYQSVYKVFCGEFAKPGDFSIRKAINEKQGKAIFLEYDLASGYLLESVYTVLLDTAMKEVLGRSVSSGRVFFILDEFPLIPKLNYMDNALNFGRSLGVRVIAGLQNIGQVHDKYGVSLGNSLMSGFGTVFAFRLFDEPSRKMIMMRHGQNKHVENILSSNSEKGIQDIVQIGNVIEEWDLTALKNGQCIISLPSGEPYIFYPVEYKK